MAEPKINEREAKVLDAMFNLADVDWCLPFRPIAENCGLDVREVRRACRSLARKGLAEYHRGLWSEDGEPAGSGYCCTKAGAAQAKAALEERLARLPDKPRPDNCPNPPDCGWRRIPTDPPEANIWSCSKWDCPHMPYTQPARAEGKATT